MSLAFFHPIAAPLFVASAATWPPSRYGAEIPSQNPSGLEGNDSRQQGLTLSRLIAGGCNQPPSVLDDPDEFQAYRVAIEEGTPQLLQALVFLYVTASERPLIGFDPMFRHRLEEARYGIEDLRRYEGHLNGTNLRLLGFRLGPFSLTLIALWRLLPYFEKIKKKGLTEELSRHIRSRLLEAAWALDDSLGTFLEVNLPTLSAPTIHPMTATRSQVEGALLGAAGGDAWAAPFESLTQEEMAGRALSVSHFEAKRGRAPGSWTDDTLLTQATLTAILQKGAVVPRVIADHFIRLVPEMESRGFGPTGRQALTRLTRRRSWRESGDPDSLGNGAAMRILPVAIFRYRGLDALRRDVILASQMTHQGYEAVAGAMAVAFIVAKTLRGEFNRRTILGETRLFIGPGKVSERLRAADRLLKSPETQPKEAIKTLGTSGLVWESVVSAIYAFLRSPTDVGESLVLVAQGGGDTDTMASITGGLSGAYNGVEALPPHWRTEVEQADLILTRAGELHDLVHPR